MGEKGPIWSALSAFAEFEVRDRREIEERRPPDLHITYATHTAHTQAQNKRAIQFSMSAPHLDMTGRVCMHRQFEFEQNTSQWRIHKWTYLQLHDKLDMVYTCTVKGMKTRHTRSHLSVPESVSSRLRFLCESMARRQQRGE